MPQDDNEEMQTMKLKTLVLAAGAAAVGYVLGTKAGRAQFEQLKAKADELAHDPRVRSGVSSIAGEVKNHADKLPDPVAGAVRAAADAVQSATTDDPQVDDRDRRLSDRPAVQGGTLDGRRRRQRRASTARLVEHSGRRRCQSCCWTTRRPR